MGKKNKQKNKLNKVSGTAVSNPAIKKAVEALKVDNSPKNQNALTMALAKGKFLAPCSVTDEENNMKTFRFLMLNTNEGQAYFPVFTDQKEADKMNLEDGMEKPQFLVRTIKDYGEMIKDDDGNAQGIIVNPNSESLVVTRDLIESIANNKIPLVNEKPQNTNVAARYVEPAVYPTKIANAVYEKACELESVSRIWLKEKMVGMEHNTIFFVEADGKDRSLLTTLREAALSVVPDAEVEVEFVNDKFMKDVIGDDIALYDRELDL